MPQLLDCSDFCPSEGPIGVLSVSFPQDLMLAHSWRHLHLSLSVWDTCSKLGFRSSLEVGCRGFILIVWIAVIFSIYLLEDFTETSGFLLWKNPIALGLAGFSLFEDRSRAPTQTLLLLIVASGVRPCALRRLFLYFLTPS
jgi:hypothetical protein